LLQRRHLLLHPRLRLHLLLQRRLPRLHPLQRLHPHPLQYQLLVRRAKPTNCFRQLFDDWLMSTKSQSTH
jgi:hypothetical protein